jgi:hypothetical protein
MIFPERPITVNHIRNVCARFNEGFDVTAERLLGVDELRSQRVDVLTEILSEITWAFWQSNQSHPTAQLRAEVERGI